MSAFSEAGSRRFLKGFRISITNPKKNLIEMWSPQNFHTLL